MKTTLFQYETSVGTFWIRPEPAGRVQLGLDRHKLRTYSSPTAAARAVADRATGWAEWDIAEGLPVPASLRQWKRPGAGTRARKKRPADTRQTG